MNKKRIDKILGKAMTFVFIAWLLLISFGTYHTAKTSQWDKEQLQTPSVCRNQYGHRISPERCK